jgi:flavin-dependent dehydrogenase
VSHVRLFAPNGTVVMLRGECVCIPRQVLDNALRQGAVDAGATFIAPLRAVAPLVEGGVVTGAVFRDLQTEQDTPIKARVTLLATGAAGEPLVKFGVCRRVEASATAVRVYVDVPPSVAGSVRDLVIAFDEAICPGYGWIFPSTGSTLNVGVGLFYDAWRPPVSKNVRVLLDGFLKRLPLAAELMRHAVSVSPMRGAPLRTAMEGASFARAGLLVIGEAAGLTYSLTGEGIGKAMESGVLAAEIAASQLRNGAGGPDRIAAAYDNELTRRYARKFRGYKDAQAWMNSRRLANFLAKRANAGTFVRGQLERMFADTADPQRLLSPWGLARALLT